MSHLLDQLTGTEVDKAHEATVYLLGLQAKVQVLDRMLEVRLQGFKTDLEAERAERRAIARSNTPMSGR